MRAARPIGRPARPLRPDRTSSGPQAPRSVSAGPTADKPGKLRPENVGSVGARFWGPSRSLVDGARAGPQDPTVEGSRSGTHPKRRTSWDKRSDREETDLAPVLHDPPASFRPHQVRLRPRIADPGSLTAFASGP